MQRLSRLGICVACGLCGLFVWGCTSSTQETSKADPLTRPTKNAEVQTAENSQKDGKTFKVLFETKKGNFVIQVHPDWAPRGAARFKELVETGFYDDCRFFRVLPNFMVQFGINGNPDVQARWRDNTIRDDPVRRSNMRGTVSFAMAGPGSRTAQVFINYKNNSESLDPQGFSPFGEVIEGMGVVDKINAEYGEEPSQGAIQRQGNAYLNREFPNLDYIKTARIIE